MDFEAFNLSWREALITIIVLLAFYVVVLYMRIRRLQHAARQTPVLTIADELTVKSAFAAYSAMQEPELQDAAPVAAVAPAAQPPADPAFAWNEPPATAGEPAPLAALEREMAQLRQELGALRAELLILRDEQRRDVAQARVTQSASPLYSDAMQLALRGNDAASISQHCGIARAEAELVVALVRNGDAQGATDGQDSLDLR